MGLFKNILIACIIALLIGIFLTLTGQRVLSAQAEDEEEPHSRITTLTIDYVVFEWWLIRWSDNQVMCSVLTEHEELPYGADILYHCGTTIHREWENTAPCPYSGKDVSKCGGMYLHRVGFSKQQREVEVELPLPQVWISLEGCTPTPPQNTCESLPNLVLIAEDPLPNEDVIRINGALDGQTFSCQGSRCSIPLYPTGPQGQTIEFWADSSFGDSSEHYTGMVRAIPWGDFMDPDGDASDQPLWYVDVLSSQWRGQRPASCSDVWEVFPEVGGPPPWLTTPHDISSLGSTISYYHLGGMLIRNGVVDASACPDGGMETGTTASECGLQAALPAVLEWQNRFDTEILKVSAETGIPAQLMKNVFSRESQFWPGIYQTFMEAGLGQMTENGADAVLLWNPGFFVQFCPLVLGDEVCQLGFGNLNETYQNMLRGALVSYVDATCLDCAVGIDLSQANFSVTVFAETLLANCVQVAQLIYNETNQSPGSLSSYEDLWRFTLVNYNAGPGCLGDAVGLAYSPGAGLNWENVSTSLDEGCQAAIDYVNDVSQAPMLTPTPTPWFELRTVVPPEYSPLPTATPVPPTPTPTPQDTPPPDITPTTSLLF